MLKTNFWRFIARFLVMGVMALPFGLPFFIVPWTANLAIIILFKFLLPCLGAAYVVFAFSHYFYLKLKLLNIDNTDDIEKRKY